LTNYEKDVDSTYTLEMKLLYIHVNVGKTTTGDEISNKIV